jgi:phage N-6-adenine-methyltransferase
MSVTGYKSNTPSEIKDSWRTPKEIFNNLNREFKFECDVAASEFNHLCDVYYTEEMDSLSLPWFDVNWCNPPYSNIRPWVEKAIKEHELGKTTVMLIPADTSVKWFKMAFDTANEVRFISGRISFINENTNKPVNGNNKGSVIFIWSKGDRKVSLIDRDVLMSIDTSAN